MPEDIAKTYHDRDLTGTSLLKLLENNGYQVTEARQRITATLAEPAVASVLGVDVGAPVLSIQRVMIDKTGRLVQLLDSQYHPDHFTYDMRFSKDSSMTNSMD